MPELLTGQLWRQRPALSPEHWIQSESLTVQEHAHATRLSLRGDTSQRAFASAVGRVLDVVVPSEACTTATSEKACVFWLGPDEFLIVSDDLAASDLEAQLRDAIEDDVCSIADVSDNYTVLRLQGRDCLDVLAQHTTLDLHPTVLNAGQVFRTTFSKAEVILHMREIGDDQAVDVYVRRSFADYVWRMIEKARHCVPA